MIEQKDTVPASIALLKEKADQVEKDRGPVKISGGEMLQAKATGLVAPCIACDKPILLTDIVPEFSGEVFCRDISCQSCSRYSRGFTKLVCKGCRLVVFKWAPHTDKDGFEYRVNGYLHLDGCPECDRRNNVPPDQIRKTSVVLERDRFIKEKYQ